jgi:hypothetical protein
MTRQVHLSKLFLVTFVYAAALALLAFSKSAIRPCLFAEHGRKGAVTARRLLQNFRAPRRSAFFDSAPPRAGRGWRCYFCTHDAAVTSIGYGLRRQILKKTIRLMQKKAQNATRAMVRIASRTSSGKLGQICLPARNTTTPAASKMNRPRGPMPGLRNWREAVFTIRTF